MKTNILEPDQKRMVGYLAPEGTFSHLTAIEAFGPVDESGFQFIGVKELPQVIESVLSDKAYWGIIPIYNNHSGKVEENGQNLLHHKQKNLEPVAYINVHIHHDLLSLGTLEEIKIVYTKKEAAQQCLISLKKILPNAEIIYCSSTAEASHRAEREGKQTAAIASHKLRAFHPKLRLLESNIEDYSDNETQFVIFKKETSYSLKQPFIFSISDRKKLQEFREWLQQENQEYYHNYQQKIDMVKSYLPSQVKKILDQTENNHLYIHPPVSTMESVWGLIGIPPSRMVNTQICRTDLEKPDYIFCSVAGDQRIDEDKVSNLINARCLRAKISELRAIGQTRGAVSPLTAPDQAIIIIDQHLMLSGIVFMGSGHPDVSVALDLNQIKDFRKIIIADIAQEV